MVILFMIINHFKNMSQSNKLRIWKKGEIKRKQIKKIFKLVIEKKATFDKIAFLY